MPDLQSLMQLAQQVGAGGGQPMPQAPGGGDVVAQLQALLGQGATTGMQPQTRVSSGANGVPRQNMANPMLAALSMMSPPPGAVSGQVTGPATDMDYMNVHKANQGVRGDLPVKPTMDYSGYGDELAPMPDDLRQTPEPSDQTDNRYRPNVGAPGAPGQAQMGAYLNANKGGMSTEQELDMVNKRMGSGDPSADGNFPSQKEIDALNSGEISTQAFDAKWGKGAAKEMLDNPDTDNDPTTRKLPTDKNDNDEDDY